VPPVRRIAPSFLIFLLGCGGGGAAETDASSSSSSTGATGVDSSTGGTLSGGTSTPTGGDTDAPTTGEPDPCTVSPQALADCVDAKSYEDDLRFVADLRMPGSPHWQAVQDLCADRLTELGYEVALQDYGTGINVVGRRLGASEPEQVVLIGAHYDHIDACHGADDNASGLAATLEIARQLARVEFDRTITIACWDEEELGLVGSEAYVTAAVAAGDKIAINFNFDMIGFKSDADDSQSVPAGFEVAFPDQNAELVAKNFHGDFIAIVSSSLAHDHAVAYAAAADRIALPKALLELPAGTENTAVFDDLRRSDHASFWTAGYPAVFLTDTGEFRNDHYHCFGGPDEVEDLDLEFAVAVTRATVEASAVAGGM
jgi:hypothetical protein